MTTKKRKYQLEPIRILAAIGDDPTRVVDYGAVLTERLEAIVEELSKLREAVILLQRR